AYQIAHAGAVLGIPQLEGDGGGSMVYALVSVVGAVTVLRFTRIASVIFLLAALMAVLISLLYADNAVMLWAVASVLLSGASWWAHRRARRLSHTKETAPSLIASNQRSRSH
ncbi:MAG: hypothetical protein OWT28_11765, partial [Firmicutes bacterium]|nr:hypothetical protein [Bacillota bacterium]